MSTLGECSITDQYFSKKTQCTVMCPCPFLFLFFSLFVLFCFVLFFFFFFFLGGGGSLTISFNPQLKIVHVPTAVVVACLPIF